MVLYHGTNSIFYQFEERFIGANDTGTVGIGFYLTDDIQLAEQFANTCVQHRKGIKNIIRFQVFPQKTLEIEGVSASVWLDKMKEIGIPDGTMRENTDALLAMGYDSVCSYDVSGNVREFVLMKSGLERYVGNDILN